MPNKASPHPVPHQRCLNRIIGSCLLICRHSIPCNRQHAFDVLPRTVTVSSFVWCSDEEPGLLLRSVRDERPPRLPAQGQLFQVLPRPGEQGSWRHVIAVRTLHSPRATNRSLEGALLLLCRVHPCAAPSLCVTDPSYSVCMSRNPPYRLGFGLLFQRSCFRSSRTLGGSMV